MKEVKVDILILNYNGKAFLKECLDSVMAIDYSNYSVVFIDNGSTDNSVDYVKSLYENVEVVQTGENKFYAGGYNYFFNKNSGESFFIVSQIFCFLLCLLQLPKAIFETISSLSKGRVEAKLKGESRPNAAAKIKRAMNCLVKESTFILLSFKIGVNKIYCLCKFQSNSTSKKSDKK